MQGDEIGDLVFSLGSLNVHGRVGIDRLFPFVLSLPFSQRARREVRPDFFLSYSFSL